MVEPTPEENNMIKAVCVCLPQAIKMCAEYFIRNFILMTENMNDLQDD